MLKKMSLTLLASVSLLAVGFHQAAAVEAGQTQYPQPTVIYADQPAQHPNTSMRMASAERSNMGGGFIEFLFGDAPPQAGRYPQPPVYQQQPAYQQPQPAYQPPTSYEPQQSLLPQAVPQQGLYQQGMPQQEEASDPTQRPFDPKFEKQLVDYHGKETAGTIVVDTPNKFLFLVQGNGKALRYGIGVGKPGFTWSGVKQITAKKEWPDWTPPAEMLQRRPDLPRHMEGGPQNPLGARAMYLGSTLYRIHGSNEPWTIGTNVSSGCIRMRNQDVIDLYGRVTVGARVVVI